MIKSCLFRSSSRFLSSPYLEDANKTSISGTEEGIHQTERKSSVAKLRGVGIPEYSHKYRNFLKMRGRDNGKIITFARNKGDDPY